MNQKGFAPILIALGIILILGIVGGTYYLGTLKNQQAVSFGNKPQSQNPGVTSQTPQPTPNETANWKTYTDTKYGFSLKYPINYNVAVLDNTKDLIKEAGITDPIPLYVSLVQDVYSNTGQPPTITIYFIKTNKTIEQIISARRAANEEWIKNLPENPLYKDDLLLI